VASRSETLRAEESDGASTSGGAPSLRWFDVEEALGMDIDPGLKRMIRKARTIMVMPA
jgi:hypothetical protein